MLLKLLPDSLVRATKEIQHPLKQSVKVAIIIILVLIIDQTLKIWIKTNMYLNEDSFLHWEWWTVSWARIHFVENKGMAFGLELPSDYGKLALSIFRIAAVGFLFYYLRLLIKAKASFGLVACFGLILAGALGNIIDSAFYGVIFSSSPSFHTGGAATMFPPEGGYDTFLHGRVVDMFYFPMLEGQFPDWFPIWGGEDFMFFRPVFNVADASITVGVVSLLLFHRSFFSGEMGEDAEKGDEPTTEPVDERALEIPTTDETPDSGTKPEA